MKRRKLKIIFWSFIWNAFKGTIFCCKRALHHGFALASKCVTNIYYLKMPTLICWKGILGRQEVTPWKMTTLHPPWLSLFRLCSLKLLSTVQNGYLMYTNVLTSQLPAAVPVSMSAIRLQPAVDYCSSMLQPINFSGAEQILIYGNNQSESPTIRIVNQNMALLWSPQMLIKRRNPLQILARKEIACEQTTKEENVRENNEHCESLSVQDEDSTSPLCFKEKAPN